MSERITALYCRVSTEAQFEEGYSIDAQKELLIAYCKAKEIKNYEIYVDGGYSGSNLNRPKIQELILKAKNNEIDTVIVYKLDRISRSQKDTMFLIEDVFLANNVDFISINESFDTSTPFGRAMIGILSVFAQLERDNIKLRTRMGMQKRVEEGYWMGGGMIPYGYDYDQNQGILVPNNDAPKVKQMYELYLKGYSCDSIAQMFDLKYDRLVYQILTRKSNTGVIVYKDKEYQGKHEAIIDPVIFERTIAEMKKRSDSKRFPSNKYLLAGFVECGVCGAKMRYQKWGRDKNGKDKCKIYCYSQQKSKNYLIKDASCDNAKNWSTEVEQAVISDMFRHIELTATDKITIDDRASEIKILEDKITSLNNKLRNLYLLFAEDPTDSLRELIAEKKAEVEKAEAFKLKELEKKVVENKANQYVKELRTMKDSWDFMTVQEKRRLLDAIIEKIIITDRKVSVYYKV